MSVAIDPQDRVDFARGEGGEFHSVQHLFNTRHTELAKLFEENPQLGTMLSNVAETVMRIVEDHGVDIRRKKFAPKIGHLNGRIIIDLGIKGL
jgi:hypothetical protein